MSELTPVYDHDGITLYHGNNRDIIPHLGVVDHVFTDPPFNENTHKNAKTNKSTGSGHKLVEFDSISYIELFKTLQLMSFDIRRWLISFMEWRYISALERDPPAGLEFIRFAVWLKTNPVPQISADRPTQGWEGIAILHSAINPKRWNGGGSSANYYTPVINNAQYSTQKPLALVKSLMLQFTDGSDLILDPFCGSGTTLIAAKELGRRAIGIDISEKAIEVTIKRLSQGVMNVNGWSKS